MDEIIIRKPALHDHHIQSEQPNSLSAGKINTTDVERKPPNEDYLDPDIPQPETTAKPKTNVNELVLHTR